MAAIPYDSDNVFFKIIEGKIPSYKVFETEHVLAILDAFPLVPGHALLLPKTPGYATILGQLIYLLHTSRWLTLLSLTFVLHRYACRSCCRAIPGAASIGKCSEKGT